jgi:hypothetical protein
MAWLSVQFSAAAQVGTARSIYARAFDGATQLTGRNAWLVNLSSTPTGIVDGFADTMVRQSATVTLHSFITGKRINVASAPGGWILMNVSRSGTVGTRYFQVCVNGVWAFLSVAFT